MQNDNNKKKAKWALRLLLLRFKADWRMVFENKLIKRKRKQQKHKTKQKHEGFVLYSVSQLQLPPAIARKKKQQEGGLRILILILISGMS
jgi:hypothetical protein